MTGEPLEYSPTDLEILCDQMGDIPDDADSFEVEGDIEWAGEYNKKPRRILRAGKGSINDALDLDRVRAAKERADLARAVLAKTPPRSVSYTAVGWRAQLRKLDSHRQGSAAAEAVGLSPARQTRQRWGKGTQRPSLAYREKIAAAYEDLATRPHREATAKAGAALRALGDELSKALHDAYESDVRIIRPGPFTWS